MRLTQYGIERTGTNHLQRLVENNTDATVLVHKPYYKHGPFIECDVDGYLISTKHPHAWLASHLRQWSGKDLAPEQMVAPATRRYLDLHASYSKYLDRDDVFLVEHDALVRDPTSIVYRVADCFDLSISMPIDPDERERVPKGDGHVEMNPKRATELNRRYYNEKWYYADFPKDLFDAMNRVGRAAGRHWIYDEYDYDIHPHPKLFERDINELFDHVDE